MVPICLQCRHEQAVGKECGTLMLAVKKHETPVRGIVFQCQRCGCQVLMASLEIGHFQSVSIDKGGRRPRKKSGPYSRKA